MNQDGTGIKNLTPDTEESDDWLGKFLPDGRIVFLSNRGKERGYYWDIYIMNSDGTDVKRLVERNYQVGGRYIEYVGELDIAIRPGTKTLVGNISGNLKGSLIEGGVIEILKDNIVIRRAMSDRNGHFIIENIPVGKYTLRANANGYQYYFHQQDIIVQENQTTNLGDLSLIKIGDRGGVLVVGYEDGIYWQNADGTNRRKLLSVNNPKSIDLSGDGRYLLYSSNIDGDYEIYIFDILNKTTKKLTNNTNQDEYQQFTQDGRIVFSRDGVIHLMDIDGSNLQQIAEGKSPTFSPDGREIVFIKPGSDYEIYIMNKDGTNIRQLTNNEIDDLEPDFSPDGTTIAYSSNNMIWTMKRDGSNKTMIVTGNSPKFSPDGKSIAFLFGNTLWILNLETLDLEQIKGKEPKEIKGIKEIGNGVRSVFWGCGFIENKAPIPIITGTNTGYEGIPITLDGSKSYDPDGTIISYLWTIDNGLEEEDSITTMVINDDYIGSLTLRVVDNDNTETETQTTITILNLNPQVVISCLTQAPINTPIQFIGEINDTDPVTLFWDFGDSATSTQLCPIHAYTSIGTYTIRLEVKDKDKGEGVGTKTIEIIEKAPEIEISPSSGFTETIITIEGVGFNEVVTIDFGKTQSITTALSSNGIFSTTFIADTQALGRIIITARDKERFATASFAIGPVTVFTKEGEIIGGYTNIQSGINACPVEGKVFVLPGVYPEAITIDKRISLIGKDSPTINPGDNNAVTFNGNSADGAIISGFIIKGKDNGIYCTNEAEPIITSNTILGNKHDGIYCYNSSPIITNNVISENNNGIYCSNSSPIITNNTIARNRDNGITCCYWPSSPSIYNNIIFENGGYGIYCDGSLHKPKIDYNCVFNNGLGGYAACSPGLNDISVNPKFIDFFDYHLKAVSFCVDRGSDTAPCNSLF